MYQLLLKNKKLKETLQDEYKKNTNTIQTSRRLRKEIVKLKGLKANIESIEQRRRVYKAEKDIVSQIFEYTDCDSEGEIMGNQQNMLTLKYNNFKPKKKQIFIKIMYIDKSQWQSALPCNQATCILWKQGHWIFFT